MSNSSEIIKNSIVTKVQAMQNISSVFDYKTSNIDGAYPVAVISIGNGGGTVNANVRSLSEYSFDIDVYIEMSTNFTPQKAERLAVEIIDEMTTAFRRDTTLSGVVTYCEQLTWETGFEVREHDTRVVNFNLVTKKIETIS